MALITIESGNELVLADRGTRLAAVLIDLLITGSAVLLVLAFYELELGLLAPLVSLALVFVVQVRLLWILGQSIGKRAMGIRIVRFENGGNPGFVKAFLLRSLLPSLIATLPYLGQPFWLINTLFICRTDRRCIHDILANTVVIKLKDEAPPMDFWARMKKTIWPLPIGPDDFLASLETPAFATPAAQALPEARAINQAEEDSFYAEIALELAHGNRDEGLWTKCYAEENGDENKTKARYIRERIKFLIAQSHVSEN